MCNVQFPQFRQRFQAEVRPLIPDMFTCDAYCPERPDYYAWCGAQRWVTDQQAAGTLQSQLCTRKDYLEKGHDYINEKFWRGW